METLKVTTVKIICNCPVCGFKNWVTAEYEVEYVNQVSRFKHICYYCVCHYEISFSVQVIKQPSGTQDQKVAGAYDCRCGPLKDNGGCEC